MPYLTPDEPNQHCEITVLVPDSLIPHLEGAIAQLAKPENWEVFGAYAIDDIVQAILFALLEQQHDCFLPITDDLGSIIVDDLGRWVIG